MSRLLPDVRQRSRLLTWPAAAQLSERWESPQCSILLAVGVGGGR